MKDYSKFIFPGVLVLSGLVLLISGASSDQNSLFMLAAVTIMLAGVITALGALGMIKKGMNLILMIVLIAGSLGLAGLNYKSIKDPVDFMKERTRRYDYVIQNLKDIRTAELAYKSAYGTYTNSFDTLLKFIRQDSLKVIKAIGTVPDTLTEQKAVEMGIVSRDTSMIAVADTIFGITYMETHHGPLVIDSLPYVPFTKSKFTLETGEIERGSVNVQVFQVTDSKPFDPKKVLKVGSLSDPSTSGNWE